jgi:hypothetical protein
MRRLLQSFIHNQKLYDRPQEEWTCGRAAEGCPCIYGPGLRGECRGTSQCLPSRVGDRWMCTRAISLGGACATGPRPDGSCGCPVPPCRPVRSLRAQRWLLTWLAASLALGLVILALWGQVRSAWSMPGPLTKQHAISAANCADCHTEAAGLPFSARARSARLEEHDRLCIKCHDLGPHGDAPHGVGPAEMRALRQTLQPATGARPVMLAAVKALGPPATLACANCHREHQGKDFDLKRMADQQCQVCHQKQFARFAEGHPEFAGYPYARRTRLDFNHVSHFQKHFSDPRLGVAGPTSCAQCHEPAPDGRKMLVRDFEHTCASCHAAQIEGAGRVGAKGLVFLRLPDIDVPTLRAAGLEVGEWPAYCEGPLTPFMRWMLEGDAPTRAALAAVDDVNLANLAGATAAQKAAAARVVWGIKDLFADLVTQGQQVIVRRLGTTDALQATVAGRTGQFSADVALASQQAWLPDLLVEVAAHRRGERLPPRAVAPPVAATRVAAPAPVAKAADPDDLLADPLPAAAAPTTGPAAAAPAPAGLPLDEAEARTATGGWYRMDDTYTINYRPGGHADAFLTAWLDGTANNPAPTAQKIFTQLAAPDAPGICIKCHAVDTTAAGTVVNWHARRPEPNRQEFTTFKHAAHFSLMGDQGCTTCHTFAVGADYDSSFGANRDPAKFHSNFAPLMKNTCAVCHQAAKSGESCQQCHNYHTGEIQKLRAQEAEIPVLPARRK